MLLDQNEEAEISIITFHDEYARMNAIPECRWCLVENS